MQTLMLLRHAKSSWDDSSLPDAERPLNERGMRDAPRVGNWMYQQKLKRPDALVCSPAVRTRQTMKLVVQAAGIQCPARLDERIYQASVADLLDVIKDAPETCDCLMLIGHNPGIAELLDHLTNEHHSMPTAALAIIEIDAMTWRDIAAKTNRLTHFIKPRDIED